MERRVGVTSPRNTPRSQDMSGQRDLGRRTIIRMLLLCTSRKRPNMNALTVGGIVFGCVFGGAVLGMLLGPILPKDHLSADSKDVIKVAIAMIATLAALVVGLLISSAKGSFDDKDTEMRRMAAQAILLDRTLAEYGPETGEIRDRLREMLATRIAQIWREESKTKVAPEAIGHGTAIEVIQRQLLDLSPQNDAQRWLKSTALQTTGDIAGARWLVFERTGSAIQWPFLTILIFWLAVIFTSFGLFAPRNGSVIFVLGICALSVAVALFLIVQMDQPYTGVIKISSAPLHAALSKLGQQ